MMLFETERFLIRRFTDKDELTFYLFNSNPIIMQFIRPVKTREDCAIFLQENLNMYQSDDVVGRYLVVEKKTDLPVGTFSFLKLNDEVNYHIGYGMFPEYWRKGIAQELVKHGTEFFFDSTNFESLFAITNKEHDVSKHVLSKSGFLLKRNFIEGGKELDLFEIQKHK